MQQYIKEETMHKKYKFIKLQLPIHKLHYIVISSKIQYFELHLFVFFSLQVSFNVSVEARDCPPRGTNQSFTIKPVGFKDYLEVSVDYQCDCSCSRTAQTNSSICSSIGTSSCLIFCSIFSAHFTWIYNHTTSSQITLDQLLVHSHLYDLKTGLNVF